MELTVQKVYEIIDKFAPYNLQLDFDNSGIMVGERNMPVRGIMVTLDTTLPVLLQAKEFGCNLIIEHHPIIFNPIKSIDLSLPTHQAICYALKNDIAIISAHTNFDFAENGLNDYVAEKMMLTNIEKENFSSPRIGVLKNKITLLEYAQALGEIFEDKNVVTIGNLNKEIGKVAVINGGGGGSAEVILDTFKNGCDVYVSGEIKHNVGRLAKDLNYAIIQVNHHNSEYDFITLMKDKLTKEIKNINVLATTMLSNPFN